ncbi:type II toxin-antitoxin system RelE family toxin [Arthrobacter livingstonensis]|uniref:type II toxin-antitoxin system RelE family toxin n=1 Tax=Arthrobacter livingstonensis TaxID=670078 RepID=UPI001B87E344|nr:type II toxin-antitoxin system RelE/ParE family toxin [Arthrobacter livingstonensis]
MSRYRIELRPAAVRALRKFDRRDRSRIQGATALLGEDPRPPGAKARKGRPGLRVRVVSHRIIYTTGNDILRIVVVTPGHRKDVYGRSEQRKGEGTTAASWPPSFPRLFSLSQSG